MKRLTKGQKKKVFAKYKECAMCGSKENLSIDHIMPHWIFSRLHTLGFPELELNKRKLDNIQVLCVGCNVVKSGRIDYRIPFVREIMTIIRDTIDKKLKESL